MHIEDRITAMSSQSELSREDYVLLTEWVNDQDAYIRDLIASLLVNFPTQMSKRLLLRLAEDADALVRADAYDSLSEFPCRDSLQLLSKRLVLEHDEVARFCAIRSYAELMERLEDNSAQAQSVFRRIFQMESSDLCKLAGCYGMYLFGDNHALRYILAYLEHTDYHVRCSAISILCELLDDKNAPILKAAVIQLKEHEESDAVISRINDFLLLIGSD